MSKFTAEITSNYPKHRALKSESDAMLYFVPERNAMSIRKERGEARCTDDPLLRDYRWTCIHRERDYTTGWFRRNIRDRYNQHEDLWWMVAAARILNWAPTCHKLMSADFMGGTWPDQKGFSIERFEKGLRKVESAGEGYLNAGAYVLVAPQAKGDKIGWIAHDVLGPLWEGRHRFHKHFEQQQTLEATFNLIRRYDHWGPFLSYQVTVDLRYCEGWLDDAPDIATWCAAGPGTREGFNMIMGLPEKEKHDEWRLRRDIVELWPLVMDATGVRFDLSDMCNILCETSKFVRALKGKHPKVRYAPNRGRAPDLPPLAQKAA